MATPSHTLVWRIPGTDEPGNVEVHRVTQSQTRLKWQHDWLRCLQIKSQKPNLGTRSLGEKLKYFQEQNAQWAHFSTITLGSSSHICGFSRMDTEVSCLRHPEPASPACWQWGDRGPPSAIIEAPAHIQRLRSSETILEGNSSTQSLMSSRRCGSLSSYPSVTPGVSHRQFI